MNEHICDVVVIGSGPGGYVSAIRASQLGLKAICVEKENLGGVCLNWGCIPTKALLKNAEYMNFLKKADEFGFKFNDLNVDFPAVIKRSRDVAGRMSKGVASLFKKYKVTEVKGFGYIQDKNTVIIKDNQGNQTDVIKTSNIVIATGARPRMFPGINVDNKKIITSKEAMIQNSIPKSMIIMGAGAIGVEFAFFYNSFGTEVTLIEMMDRILPIEDEEISKELERNFRKQKIKTLTSTKVISADIDDGNVKVVIQKKDGSEETINADIALNAIGIQANIENIGLENVHIAVEKGFIKVDNFMRTNIDHIFAIGDVAGPPWLAHKASAEGILVSEFIAGHTVEGINYDNIPGCTYCQPQVASIGLTETKAKETGIDVKVGKFPFTASGKAQGIGEATGFIKIIFDARYGEIIGAHMIGPDVTELIAEVGIARSLEATARSIFKTIHAHPTLSEAIMEASANAWGEAVNI